VRLSAEFGGAGAQLAVAGQEPAVAATAVVGVSGGRPRCEIGVHAATAAVMIEKRTAVLVRRIMSALGCGL